jgi:hypothetical protein
MTGAQKIGELSVKLADAALVARERGDDVDAIFFATKAAECLQLAKALGWEPGVKNAIGDELRGLMQEGA